MTTTIKYLVILELILVLFSKNEYAEVVRVAKLAKRSRLSSSEILVCLLLSEICCQGLFILLSSAGVKSLLVNCEVQFTIRHGQM